MPHPDTQKSPQRIIRTANWILRDGEKVLSVRSHGRDRFYLPGGKIDPGETARDAIIREVTEELGVTLIDDSIREIGTFAGHGKIDPGVTWKNWPTCALAPIWPRKYTGNFKCRNQPSKQAMGSITSDLGMNCHLVERRGEFCDGLLADI